MMKKSLIAISAIAMSLVLTVSCGSDDDGGAPPVERADFKVDFIQLDPLEGDFIYEGWLIVDGSPVSTGTFDGTEDEYTFNTAKSDLDSATRFVVSIEPVPDTDPMPAATKILSGDFVGDRADITLNEIADFSNVSGNFEIFSPSDTDDMNEENGIWFVTTTVDPMTMEESFEAGLNLPTLSAGWKYEGWVIFEKNGVDVPVSTGTFTDLSALDEVLTYNGGNVLNIPPFPGEDFLTRDFESGDITLTFPEDGDVTGKIVVISVEPSPDNDPAPFFVKPLEGIAGSSISPASNMLSRKPTSLGALGTVTR